MRTPEQIIDDSILSQTNIKPSENEAVSLWHAIWILYDPSPAKHVMKYAMQEHAIEFLEWANREQTHNHLKGRDDYGWYYEKPSKYPWGVREEFIGDTRDLYRLYLKSIEPKTT